MSPLTIERKKYLEKWRSKNRDKIRASGKKYRANAGHITRVKDLRLKYGITPEQYDEMLRVQNGVCKICGKTPVENGKFLTIDHCHKTKCVRGLVCYRCNTGLASFKDDALLLKKATEYLGASFNSHDELLEIARKTLEILKSGDREAQEEARQVESILAKAEGRES